MRTIANLPENNNNHKASDDRYLAVMNKKINISEDVSFLNIRYYFKTPIFSYSLWSYDKTYDFSSEISKIEYSLELTNSGINKGVILGEALIDKIGKLTNSNSESIKKDYGTECSSTHGNFYLKSKYYDCHIYYNETNVDITVEFKNNYDNAYFEKQVNKLNKELKEKWFAG